MPADAAWYKAFRRWVEPRLEILLWDDLNFPDSNTEGSNPAKAINFLTAENREISPISQIMVAAVKFPTPGMEVKRWGNEDLQYVQG